MGPKRRARDVHRGCLLLPVSITAQTNTPPSRAVQAASKRRADTACHVIVLAHVSMTCLLLTFTLTRPAVR